MPKILTKDEIQKRFNNHMKLSDLQLEVLFGPDLTNMQKRYLQHGIRYQFIYDIETSDFDPEQNFIICYCGIMRDILTGEVEYLQDSITKKDIHTAVEKHTFDFDYRLLQTLSYNIKHADQVVGHYSTKFDNKYFRSRCLFTKQEDLIPDYGDVSFGDTWRMMKTTMKAKRNTLKNFIRQTTGNDEKSFVDLKYWYITHFKDHKLWKQSMDYIIDHCVKDVRMTYEGLLKVERFNAVQRMKA